MTINWTDVLTTVGSGGVVLAAAAWLTKTIITDRLGREADAFKARVKADSDAEIERLRSSLQMTALEHQVRFSRLHEKRAEVIAELYQHLIDASFKAQRFSLTMGPASRSDASKQFEELHRLDAFIQKHRIYFPVDVCGLLEEFFRTLRETVVKVSVYGSTERPATDEEWERKNAALRSAYTTFETELPQALLALERAFREILGEAPKQDSKSPPAPRLN
jgi:hypothetical protein